MQTKQHQPLAKPQEHAKMKPNPHNEVTLGFFDCQKMDYKRIPIREQVEVLSLVGNIALNKDEPKVHAHVVLGKADGTAYDGHILETRVWPTLELIVVRK